MPIAAKLLLCLTAINGSLKVALGMVSGDKMKFLIETLVTTGFYLFLIMNWFNGDYTTASGDKMSSGMNLMGSLMEGFRSIGQQAGGFTAGSAPTNDIIGIACKMFLAGVGEGGGALSITSPIMSLATLIALFAMVVLLFLTGLEMVMARIEFVTLAMISIIMIPWGALKQTSFLFKSALRAKFNLAVQPPAPCIASYCWFLRN